ncbi:unnamed protein product [Toxocara canis]|uniref:Uncharacterized protein n=1 Tax=Toxocara canis TaxID=6265 RepID=A0A183V614_TOXCA|nr:unnamed protein product [Toxocara canis]
MSGKGTQDSAEGSAKPDGPAECISKRVSHPAVLRVCSRAESSVRPAHFPRRPLLAFGRAIASDQGEYCAGWKDLLEHQSPLTSGAEGMKVKIRQYFRRREGPRDRYLLDGLVAGLRSATCKNLDEKRPSRAETMRTRQWRFARFARRHSFQSQRMRVAMIPLDLHQPLNAQRFCAATHEEKIAIVHEISSNVDIGMVYSILFVRSDAGNDADMWTVLLFCFAGARADEVKKVIFHTIPSTVDMANKTANKTSWKIEGRSVQPTRLYRKRILTPAENTILIVAIGVTIIVALCLVCIVALQCYCSKAEVSSMTFGEDSESDSNSSLSSISSPIILEMLKLELERQKRERREESIESDEEDGRV